MGRTASGGESFAFRLFCYFSWAIPKRVLLRGLRGFLSVIFVSRQSGLRRGGLSSAVRRKADGQSVRGLKSSISRVAANNKLKVSQWDVDGVLYVKLV